MEALKTVNFTELQSDQFPQLYKVLEDSLAPNTRNAYSKDWNLFSNYCQFNHLDSLPANGLTIARFLTEVRTITNEKYRPSTLKRTIVSIRKKHNTNSFNDPTDCEAVSQVMRSLSRTEDRDSKQSAALTLKDLQSILQDLSNNESKKALRDRVLLLLGFGGGFRRSELAGLKLSDVTFTDFGFSILLKRSKTDQLGKGLVKQFVYGKLPYTCPVRTLKEYINRFMICQDQRLLLQVNKGDNIIHKGITGHSINSIIKSYFVGLSAHSMRVGFVTEAHKNGKSNAQIGLQTGQSNQTIDGYIRLTKNVENNAIIGLL